MPYPLGHTALAVLKPTKLISVIDPLQRVVTLSAMWIQSEDDLIAAKTDNIFEQELVISFSSLEIIISLNFLQRLFNPLVGLRQWEQ